MAARISSTGVTPQDFGRSDRTPGTGVNRTRSSADVEAAAINLGRPLNDYSLTQARPANDTQRKAYGTKVNGATNVNGGKD